MSDIENAREAALAELRHTLAVAELEAQTAEARAGLPHRFLTLKVGRRNVAAVGAPMKSGLSMCRAMIQCLTQTTLIRLSIRA